jgi:hypothetical protein
MKKPGCWLALLVVTLCCGPAMAQVKVEVTADQDQFLPGEPIVAIARVHNRSGQTLRLGANSDWLTFSVESRDGVPVQKLGDAPVKGDFALPSASRATKRVEISPYFNLTQTGRYSITATVRMPGWPQEVVSQPFAFNVIEGSHLWEQEFGVPGTAKDAGSPPEVRKYILQQANYLKGKLRLYLRITDQNGLRVFKTIPIGVVLTFSHPQTEIDEKSNLHLIYQSWARSFAYFEFSPDGEQLKSEMYDFIGERPHLGRDSKGNLCVLGGVLREPVKQSASAAPVSDEVRP